MPYKHLSIDERKIIFYLGLENFRLQRIANILGRHKSTISREFRRYSAHPGYAYNEEYSQFWYEKHLQAPQQRKKTGDRELMAYVEKKLNQEWSPEQISGRLKAIDSVGGKNKSISFKTIYRWLKADKQRGGKLSQKLRQGRKKYRKPYGRKEKRGPIKDRCFIEERPDVVDLRTRTGDWEGDTIIGKRQKGSILTLVERRTGKLISRKLKDRSAETLKNTLINAMSHVSKKFIKTITFDNGPEFSQFKEIEDRLKCKVYFANPYASWERGTNENTNGLLRQYIPKGTDFGLVTDKSIARYTRRINNRPRKRLKYQSPCSLFRNSEKLHL